MTEALVPVLTDMGLQVNFRKSVFWGPGMQLEGVMVGQIPGETPIGHPIRAIPVVPFGPSAGITLLGVPCDTPGSHMHASAKWEAAVQATSLILCRLRKLPDGQIRHALIGRCLDACKVNHLMRSMPQVAGVDAMGVLSDALKTAVIDLVGCGLTTGAWEQASLPISKGGLGVRDPM